MAVAGILLLRSAPSPSTGAEGRLADAQFPWELDPPPRSLVPLDEIVSGGPPPDGIPPIDEPKFVSVADARKWISAREPVISLERQGEARAYPLQILTWHEIVNDVVAGDPITVTFCPLCNSAIAFEREIAASGEAGELLGTEETVLDFGTSGRLYRSNLVMYDRQTKSLWIQFTGKAVAGPFIETELEKVPVQIVSWSDFSTAHPDGRVLSRDTGITRAYGTNPYVGYDDIGSSPFLFDGPTDDRLRPMERLVAVTIGESSKAFRYASLSARAIDGSAVLEDNVGGKKLVIFYRRGTASALDASTLASSKDVGTTGVFELDAQGRDLTFEVRKGEIVDVQTRSTWSIEGRAESGKLKGAKLTPVVHDDTFWFVWAAFRPDTSIWR